MEYNTENMQKKAEKLHLQMAAVINTSIYLVPLG